MSAAPQTRDYFAEMYVAGILADAGWNVYFPRRDRGFDFIITKRVKDRMIVRPVQVKGRYPVASKGDATFYGYMGALSELHDDMVLAIAFFPTNRSSPAPQHVAYMPRARIRPQPAWGYACNPARFRAGCPEPRRDFKKYFDADGIRLMEAADWR